ncbi:MAG: HAD family hydrolase [Vicinamibacterales bacterium]
MNLALFDFDGTITRSDSWTPFMRLATGHARKAIGYVVLLPIGAGYYAGLVAGRTARPLYARVAFRGVEATPVRDLGRRYAAEMLPRTVRPRALEQIAWHKSKGDTVVVVSASLAAYVQPWCEKAGVGCIATELEERRGRLTGRYLGGECTGAEKAARIRQRYDLGQFAEVFAYGDTAEDRDMLALANRRFYGCNDAGDYEPAS